MEATGVEQVKSMYILCRDEGGGGGGEDGRGGGAAEAPLGDDALEVLVLVLEALDDVGEDVAVVEGGLGLEGVEAGESVGVDDGRLVDLDALVDRAEEAEEVVVAEQHLAGGRR